MNLITILGFTAGILTTIAFLPQVYQTWKSKSAKDVSMVMLITFSLGLFLWLIYGILIKELPVILANLITLILNGIILTLKIRYR